MINAKLIYSYPKLSTFTEWEQYTETKDYSHVHGLLYAFIQCGKTDQYVLRLENSLRNFAIVV
jgi:hypothetical protein